MISKITAIIMSIVALISNLSGILPSKQMLYTDVSYGDHQRNVMDVCFPENPDKKEGLVVFIHGGAWISGDKSNYTNRIKSISEAVGCITATINYRFASADVHTSDMLNDITNAIKKIKSMAESRGIDCDKVLVAGFSAGAHLALLYGYTQQAKSPMEICAVVSYSGPTDLRSEKFQNGILGASREETLTLMSYLTGTNLFKLSASERNSVLYKYSPLKYVTSETIPTLVVHGTIDEVVDVKDARNFVSKLNSKEVACQYFELPDSGHSLAEDKYIFDKSEKTFVDFVNLYIK